VTDRGRRVSGSELAEVVRREEKGSIREQALLDEASSDLWRLKGGVRRSVE
jgi:hypothetical protein